jgi:hypothetical protein
LISNSFELINLTDDENSNKNENLNNQTLNSNDYSIINSDFMNLSFTTNKENTNLFLTSPSKNLNFYDSNNPSLWIKIKRQDSLYGRSLLMYGQIWHLNLIHTFNNILKGNYNLYIRHAITSDPSHVSLREEMYMILSVKGLNTAIVKKIPFIPKDMYTKMIKNLDKLENYLVCKFNIPYDCSRELYFEDYDYNCKFFNVNVTFVNKDGKFWKTGWLLDSIMLEKID